jgi:hypothetical protein
MITKTSPTGVYYPNMALSRQPDYEMKPNLMMTDVRSVQVSHDFLTALAIRAREESTHGQGFVSQARDVATWNVEPRAHYAQVYNPRAHLGPVASSKGRTINTYA